MHKILYFKWGKKKLKKEKKRKKEDFLVNIKMIKIKDCKKNISVSDIGICLTLGFRSGWIFFLTPSSQTQEKHCAQKLMIILHGPIEVNSIVSQHRGKQSQVFYWLNSSAGRWISLQNLFRLPISTRLDRRLLVANWNIQTPIERKGGAEERGSIHQAMTDDGEVNDAVIPAPGHPQGSQIAAI